MEDDLRRSYAGNSLLSNEKFKEIYMMITNDTFRKEKSMSFDKMSDAYSDISKINTNRSKQISFEKENSFIPVITDKKFNTIKTSGFNKIPISQRKINTFLNIKKPLLTNKTLFNKLSPTLIAKKKTHSDFFSPNKITKKSNNDYTSEFFTNELDRFSNRLKGYHTKLNNNNNHRPLFHVFLK